MSKSNRLTMKSIPVADRPTEKLSRLGGSALSDAELLAIIIRSGTVQESALSVCQRLLAGEGGADDATSGLRVLLDKNLEELKAVPGIGPVRAAQIKAALELGNRLQSQGHPASRPTVRVPEDAIQALESEMRFLPREEFRAILLDIRNRIIRISSISAGSLNAAIVHPRDLFRDAVKSNAAALILAHNHPSGDCTPSQEDIDATVRFMEMGKLMGVRIVDHIVIAQGGSVSMRQLGLI